MPHKPRKLAPVWKETGTPELQAKKAMLVRGGNPALSTDALGVLVARDLIDKDQYSAGQWFGALRTISFGRDRLPMAAAGQLVDEQVEGRAEDDVVVYSDEDVERLYARYRSAVSSLKRVGASVYVQTRNVCLFAEMPDWIEQAIPHGPPIHRQPKGFQQLLMGLDELIFVRTNRRPKQGRDQ